VRRFTPAHRSLSLHCRRDWPGALRSAARMASRSGVKSCPIWLIPEMSDVAEIGTKIHCSQFRDKLLEGLR